MAANMRPKGLDSVSLSDYLDPVWESEISYGEGACDMGLAKRPSRVAILLLTILGAGSLGSSGCPAGMQTSLFHQAYTNVSCCAYESVTCGSGLGTESCGYVGPGATSANASTQPDLTGSPGIPPSFQPTAVGKTIVVTLTGSDPTTRIPATIWEGVSNLAQQSAPNSSTTTLTFVSQSVNVHRISVSFANLATTGAIGSTITVDAVQQP
jgi:hypothetical protein